MINPTPGEHVRENYRAQGRKQEQERIIKLIEGSIRECECASVGMTYCRHNWTQIDLIALIKGENK
jgi:hypothetical protein